MNHVHATCRATRSGEIFASGEGLTTESLQAITKGEALIVRVPAFTKTDVCVNIAKGLQSEGYKDYLNAPMVGRIGMSFFETAGKPEIINHYFRTALPNIHTLRNACAPFQSPIDVFRCALDEAWPHGAHLQSLGNQKMFVGLSRNMKPGTPLLAHHDMFARLAPNDIEANDLLAQYAVNVYVDVPEHGGELLMWRDEISDAEFLDRRGSKYGMDIEPLGTPDIVVKPQVGDLILFNARKLHAVASGQGSDRLTVSCFVGFRGADKPLTVWS